METTERKPRRFKWGFLSSTGVILALIVVGQIVGLLLEQYPPARALVGMLKGIDTGPVLSAMRVQDWVFTTFLSCAVVCVVLTFAPIKRFFLSMQTGVSLVALATIAVTLGVLVPQIEQFEDPDERITAANYEVNYKAFRWAEGYFFYHLLRPYGIGMPEVVVPPQAEQGLERYGRIYGKAEEKNRHKMMKAAFSGRSKSEEIGAFINEHDALLRKAFDVCTFLELNRTYKSNWFTALLGLLGTAVLLNLLRGDPRKLFTIQKIGFAGAHVGMLLILSGGFVSKMFTDRGRLDLYLDGGSKDTYASFYNPEKPKKMPFAVRLDRFARKEWKALEVTFLDEQFTSRPPRWTLWEGRTIPLDFVEDQNGEWIPRVELRVRELHDRAEVGPPRVREGEQGDGQGDMPIVELEVPNVDSQHDAGHEGHDHAAHPHDETRLVHLSPLLRTQAYRDPDDGFRLAVTYDKNPAALFPDEPDIELGTLDVQVLGAGDVTPIPIRVRLGERVDLPRGYAVEFVDATTDFQMRRDRDAALQGAHDERPLAERPDRFAAVWLDVYPPEGPAERRIVIEVLDPVEYGLQEQYENKEIVAKLRWDRWSSPGPTRYALGYQKDGTSAVLVSENGTRYELEADQPLPIPGGEKTVLKRLMHHARFEKNLTFLENEVAGDGFDATFYGGEPRGLVLDVVHDPGTENELVETVTMATTKASQSNLWVDGDQRFAVQFIENTEGFPQDWRSVLSVVKRDAEGRPYTVDAGTEKEREIRVNDYFHFKTSWLPGTGYRFFQTNADPTMPNYSGVGVVYDPGIPIVMLGMWVVIAATAAAFLVRPIVRAKQGRAA
jgi:hypothetical protein